MKMRWTIALAITVALGLSVGLATAQDGWGKKKAEAPTAEGWSVAYPLSTCPVSGEELGSMGDPIVKKYDGREIRFCCGGCVGKFEASKDEMLAKVDAAIIKQSAALYPLSMCVVTDEPLVDENGDPVMQEFVVGNQMFRTCCKMCVRKVHREPAKYAKKIAKAAAEAQRSAYPLTTCVISGEPLDGGAETVVANRLVKTCCKRCKAKVDANPAPSIAKVDEAWKKTVKK